MSRFLLFLFCLVLLFLSALRADDSGTVANLTPCDFESGTVTYNPWAGVDDQGNLQVITGTQRAVSDKGAVDQENFSPGVAIGDLNGDGLPDLVVGDARGYFWFFPNSGKPDAPVFTHGEVIPIWLGNGHDEGDSVPRLQLVDYTGERKLSLVAGNFLGGLYYFHNRGSTTAPDFILPQSREDVQVFTHSDNVLWCNYLSPFLFDWSGTGRLDLVMGDGSYSANSIFLFKNQGSNERPIFNEKFRTSIIPGMGREHLTPAVVDWNNDGKPDIIAGERSGFINLYLNQGTDNTAPPVFDFKKPTHIVFGTAEQITPFPTVAAADLNHDKLFDLVVGSPDGHINYALNTGTPGSPKFSALTPIKGVNPYPKIIAPAAWTIDRYRPDGSPNELLECTNPTVEKGFLPPPDPFKGKGAMKFSVVKPNNVYFTKVFQPAIPTRFIAYANKVSLDADVSYTLSMWVQTDGDISGLTWYLKGGQGLDGGGKYTDYTGAPMGGSGGWSRVSTEVKIPKTVTDNPDHKKESGTFNLWLQWEGDGTIYFDDITLKQTN